MWQLNFNMDRVKDKRIRDAIALAMPASAAGRADGGAYGGEPATSLMSPTTPGYDKTFDPFGRAKKPNGDIAAAKKLIDEAGAKGKKLVYAYANTPVRTTQANLIINNLKKVGFDIQKKEVDAATWYEQMGKVKNGFDLYMTGWGQDWASGYTVFPPSFDGAQIQDGSSNYSHTNDKHVNDEIDAHPEDHGHGRGGQGVGEALPVHHHQDQPGCPDLLHQGVPDRRFQRRWPAVLDGDELHRPDRGLPQEVVSTQAVPGDEGAAVPASPGRRLASWPPTAAVLRAAHCHASISHTPDARRSTHPSADQRLHVLHVLRHPAGPGDAGMRQELHSGRAGAHSQEPRPRQAGPRAVLGLHVRHLRRP